MHHHREIAVRPAYRWAPRAASAPFRRTASTARWESGRSRRSRPRSARRPLHHAADAVAKRDLLFGELHRSLLRGGAVVGHRACVNVCGMSTRTGLVLNGSPIHTIQRQFRCQQRINRWTTPLQCLEIVKADRVDRHAESPRDGNRIEHRFHVELQDVWADLARRRRVNAIRSPAPQYFSVGGNVRACRTGPAAMSSRKARCSSQRRPAHRAEHPRLREADRLRDQRRPLGLAAMVALLCDVTVAAQAARIGDPHVKIGLVAGDGGAVIWPMLVGPNRAKEFLMRGNLIGAVEAERIGLVNYAPPGRGAAPGTGARAGSSPMALPGRFAGRSWRSTRPSRTSST